MSMTARRGGNLGFWCEAAAREFSSKTAIFDLVNDQMRETSYAALDDSMNRVASWVIEAGLKPGDRLVIATGNRVEFIESVFGAMRAGAVPVPVNTKLGIDSLRHVLHDCGCCGAIVEPACGREIVPEIDELGSIPRLVIGDELQGWQTYGDALRAGTASFEPPELDDDHPCIQPYTSGTTGTPKGVVLTHKGQLWWIHTRQKYWPYSATERTLVSVPLFHKNAMAGAIKPLLHCGGSIVLLPQFEPAMFLRILADYRCTMASAVPTIFQRLLRETDLIDSLDFSELKLLRIGSSPPPAELAKRIEEAFGCRVTEAYGLTEGGPVMIGPSADGRIAPAGSCGVAWPEGEVKLVDKDGTENDSDGELWVRNPGVMQGYFNLPDITAGKLIDGWLATGDVFHRDASGFFFFRGRVDDMFVCGGENIYPKEVENLLIANPAVIEACVVPLDDPLKGSVPVAMVVARSDGEADEESLRSYTIEHGAVYAHPRRIAIVDSMPLTSTGKVDRMRIQELMRTRFQDDINARRDERRQPLGN